MCGAQGRDNIIAVSEYPVITRLAKPKSTSSEMTKISKTRNDRLQHLRKNQFRLLESECLDSVKWIDDWSATTGSNERGHIHQIPDIVCSIA